MPPLFSASQSQTLRLVFPVSCTRRRLFLQSASLTARKIQTRPRLTAQRSPTHALCPSGCVSSALRRLVNHGPSPALSAIPPHEQRERSYGAFSPSVRQVLLSKRTKTVSTTAHGRKLILLFLGRCMSGGERSKRWQIGKARVKGTNRG